MRHVRLVKVECYEGSRGAEEPRRLRFADRVVEVEEVLDRWVGVDHRYFKLAGSDGLTYLVRYDEGASSWELVRVWG